jgi:hypothetical protein
MNAFEQLRQQARTKRDKAIEAARTEYVDTLCEISKLVRTLHRKNTKTRRYRVADYQSFSDMTAIRAAEVVLLEGKPLTIVEIVLEVQGRGCRTGDDPRRVANAILSSLYYHRNRFRRDEKGRWSLVPVDR